MTIYYSLIKWPAAAEAREKRRAILDGLMEAAYVLRDECGMKDDDIVQAFEDALAYAEVES